MKPACCSCGGQGAFRAWYITIIVVRRRGSSELAWLQDAEITLNGFWAQERILLTTQANFAGYTNVAE